MSALLTPLSEVLHMQIAAAYLCPGCNSIGNSSTQCPACANEQGLMNLSGLLDRESEEANA